MRERELQKQMEGDAFFSEADIDDAAELLLEQERRTRQTEATSRQSTHTPTEHADDDVMLDEMVLQQERELDEMLTAYEVPAEQQRRPHSPGFGDDEDYDALFMELASQDVPVEDHDMDMS